MGDGAGDGAAECVFKHWCAIRRAPPLLHVRKIERDHRDSACRKTARIIVHERVKMTRTSPMGEHQQRIERPIALSRVECGGHGGVGIARELEGNRHDRSL